MYGDDARKYQPGCKYPKTDTVTSQENFIGSRVSVIPRSAENCFLQPTGPVLQATSNHLFNSHTSLYAIWTPINQDLNMAESLDPNCKQSFKITNSATEFDTELFQTDIRELSQELPEHTDDSNPVQDGIHDFLPEHVTASIKTRDKRKRKPPKSTATTRINPTKAIPVNMPTSSQPPLPSTKLQTINPGPPPTTIDYLLHANPDVNPTSVLPKPPPIVFSDDVQAPPVQSSPQDTVKSPLQLLAHLDTNSLALVAVEELPYLSD
ncbi:hypothetical protein ACTXT7_014294 [Hymenolepis weldensis]